MPGNYKGWHNGKDFQAVAKVIGRFDLVALQEVMHPDAAKRLARQVQDQTGEPWGVITSHVVGHGSYQEGYAFLWRKSDVAFEGGATLYLDPGDHFVRQPFSARFRGRGPDRNQDFVAATVHIKYGDNEADRAPEIKALADYWRWLGTSFPGRPRLLMGDFNTPPDNPAWQQLKPLAHPLITHGASTLSKRPAQYAHLYDNVWVSSGLDIRQSGIAHYPQWLGITHRQAFANVSDHAPVYLVLGQARVETGPFRNVSAVSAEKPRQACIALNTASLKQLEQLDQVGPSRAAAIIKGRPWSSVDALVAVRGIDDARIADIRGQGLLCGT